MPGETNNPFRQVALVLISLTIIVLGVASNQATSKSEAETTTTPKNTVVSYNPPMGADTSQSTAQPNTLTTTPTIDTTTGNNQTTVTPATPDWEQLSNSLELISQLAKLSTISFAYNNFDIKLPGIGLVGAPTTGNTSISLPTTLDTSPAAPSVTPQTSTPTTPPTTNKLVSAVKIMTGYSRWENFKTKFREAEQKYAGTGKCMIDISSFGFGCLATW